MKLKDNPRHVMLITVISFLLPPVFQIASVAVYPPDFSQAYPLYFPEGVLLLQFGGAFYMLGLTIIAMKAEQEGYILAAAGFAAQAISMGIAASGLFDITSVTSAQSYEQFYYITVTSNFLMVPSLCLIATYRKFKLWVRILTLLIAPPLLISTILFLFNFRDYKVLEEISNVGYFIMMFVVIFWAWNIYSNYKKESEQEKA